jgi:hypothetical protein
MQEEKEDAARPTGKGAIFARLATLLMIESE